MYTNPILPIYNVPPEWKHFSYQDSLQSWIWMIFVRPAIEDTVFQQESNMQEL